MTNSNPQDLAEEVNLRYVTDQQPGFSRLRYGKKFQYYDLLGERIVSPVDLSRIDELKIPPAWEYVWICPFENGHLQVTGRDEKNRKQYIYHTKWNQISNSNKFDKMVDFSQALPEIRVKVTRDMDIPGLKQEKILATIVWLLDHTYIRIGNEEYAESNGHYGLTTLRSKHVTISGPRVIFEFVGKSGKKHQVGVSHPRVIKTIKKLEELPGYELFQYISEDGEKRPVDSQEVNQYIKSIAKDAVTAKDFRTWGGTVMAADNLDKIGDYKTKTDLKHNLTQTVKNVSKNLGNTPKVCRSYYIHPTVVKTYETRLLIPHFEQYDRSKIKGLNKIEYATSTLLKKYSN